MKFVLFAWNSTWRKLCNVIKLSHQSTPSVHFATHSEYRYQTKGKKTLQYGQNRLRDVFKFFNISCEMYFLFNIYHRKMQRKLKYKMFTCANNRSSHFSIQHCLQHHIHHSQWFWGNRIIQRVFQSSLHEIYKIHTNFYCCHMGTAGWMLFKCWCYEKGLQMSIKSSILQQQYKLQFNFYYLFVYDLICTFFEWHCKLIIWNKNQSANNAFHFAGSKWCFPVDDILNRANNYRKTYGPS